jgi:hypothetical protein
VSDSEQDDEFEAYLKRRVPIDKGMSPLNRLEPPAELDRIVIGKARKAIQGASPLQIYRAPKWALPVGLAATILVSFAILLDLGVRAKRNEARSEPATSPAGSIAAPEGAAPAQSAPAASAVTLAAETEPEFTSDRARTRLARAEKAAKRARPEAETGVRLQEEVVVSAPRRAAADTAYSSAAPIAAAPDISPEAGLTSVPIPAPALPPAQPGPNTAKRDTLEPASWLAKIDKLRSTGQTAEADSEMKRFREAYPDYPVPKPAP